MKKTRSMIATLGMGFLSVALAVFTNGCSCFFPCEKTESDTPAVPVKAGQEKEPGLSENGEYPERMNTDIRIRRKL